MIGPLVRLAPPLLPIINIKFHTAAPRCAARTFRANSLTLHLADMLAVCYTRPMDPIEPGDLVRCPSCGGKRWRAWAPGVLACEACQAWASLYDFPVEKGARLRCARRCRRGMVTLESATATRPGTSQCVECHEVRPLPFDALAIRILTPARVLWRSPKMNAKRYKTA